jgi:hypothetical protein
MYIYIFFFHLYAYIPWVHRKIFWSDELGTTADPRARFLPGLIVEVWEKVM